MNRADFSMILRAIIFLACLALCSNTFASEIYVPSRHEISQGDVEIVMGEDRTIYEYRVSGRLLIIKVVPKVGFTYYMVPADGSAHFESLDHSKKLYPKWVLGEW